ACSGGRGAAPARAGGARGPRKKAGPPSGGAAPGGPGRATPEHPPGDAERGPRHGRRGPRQPARRLEPTARSTVPLDGAPMHGGGHADLVLEAPVDDVAVPAHAHGVDVEGPDGGMGEGLVEGGAW